MPAAYSRMPALSTRGAPYLSAIAPAKGCPSPHNRFWIASASANTSRPHPFAWDSGVKKKPSEERGPKLSTEIRQPHRMMTAGVRQDIGLAMAAGVVEIMGFSGGQLT